MDEHDYAEILQFLQDRMQQFGLAELNDRLIVVVRDDDELPSNRLDRYLQLLESELRLRSSSTVGILDGPVPRDRFDRFGPAR